MHSYNRAEVILLMTAYSAGRRVSELVKITNIDAERMTIRVKQGKDATWAVF